MINDADIEQMELTAMGNEAYRGYEASARVRDTDPDRAADLCSHGWIYPLNSLAAKHASDPNHGEEGVRCRHCGSRLSGDPWEDTTVVLVPCEIAPND